MFTKILSTPTAQLGRAGRLLVFQIKLWRHCIRLLIKNRSGQQAAALSYHTIFGIVPLAIVVLLIFQLFPAYSDVGTRVKNIVYEQLHLTTIQFPSPSDPDQTIMFTEHLDKIVAKVFEGFKTGTIAMVSAALIIWAALALLSTIERAFNNIWRVSTGRNFLRRIINYWALLTLGPLLLGLGIYLTTTYVAFGDISQKFLTNVAPLVLSYIVSTVAFFLLYFVLPNTKVQAKAAIWGAAVAALAWALAKWGFGFYVTKAIPYAKIYGVVGLIPLTVLWIYITWIIVLFGLQLTFTTQHLTSLDAAEIASARRTEDYFVANDFTAINIVREIAAEFESGKAPVASEVVLSRLNIPAEFGEKLLDHLVSKNLLAKTSQPDVGYLPARDPEKITLAEIARSLAAAGFAQSLADQPHSLRQIALDQQDALAKYNIKQLL